MSSHQRASTPEPLEVLRSGTIELEGRMPWSSNNTFLVSVTLGDTSVGAIYKPEAGERRLWDFPSGLFRREVAAYQLSELLGWQLVPLTVIREDAPLGIGSLQEFVDADFSEHYFTLLEDEQHHPALRRMAVFDIVANNADRKGGHCLIDKHGHIWGIDHGLCFNHQPKLRTVIWDFAGEPFDADQCEALERLAAGGLPSTFDDLLEPEERTALSNRVERALRRGRFPNPGSERPYPWPLV